MIWERTRFLLGKNTSRFHFSSFILTSNVLQRPSLISVIFSSDPAFARITCTCCRSVDVISEAISSKKATWGSMSKLDKCSQKYWRYLFSPVLLFFFHELLFIITSWISEASRSIVCNAWQHWWLIWVGDTRSFTWTWRIWFQWSFCTSAHTYHRICTWSSL